jgi:hypothetical protein
MEPGAGSWEFSKFNIELTKFTVELPKFNFEHGALGAGSFQRSTLIIGSWEPGAFKVQL